MSCSSSNHKVFDTALFLQPLANWSGNILFSLVTKAQKGKVASCDTPSMRMYWLLLGSTNEIQLKVNQEAAFWAQIYSIFDMT